MCTVTIFKSGDKTILTMNRDEARDRPKETPPNVHGNMFFPVDTQAGGTWIGANKKGDFYCLLNRYDSGAPAPKFSRGLIIPKLLKESDAKITESDYSPFTLVSFVDGLLSVKQWDGNIANITHEKDYPFFITSTSYEANSVKPYRKKLFETFLPKKADTPEQILAFHMAQEQGMEDHAINVSRIHSRTTSITQIIISASSQLYQYVRDGQTIEGSIEYSD